MSFRTGRMSNLHRRSNAVSLATPVFMTSHITLAELLLIGAIGGALAGWSYFSLLCVTRRKRTVILKYVKRPEIFWSGIFPTKND